MIKRIEIEARNEKEALEKASEILKLREDQIKLVVLKEKKGILGIGSSVFYEAKPKVDLGIAGKEYLEEILVNLGIDAKMEFRTLNDGEELHYRLNSKDNALLIGRDGKTLQALQFLLRNYINVFTDGILRITLDIGDYQETRKRLLEILATKTAKGVVSTKIDAKLDPMNSYERRIIHAKLSEWNNISTESEGEGEERAVVIKYKK